MIARWLRSTWPIWMLGMTLGAVPHAIAAPPETAPAELAAALSEIEAAANRQDLAAVMAFYGDSYRHADGFNRTQFEATLRDLWAQQTTITYDLELLSWEAEGAAIVAETLTTIRGTRLQDGREFDLTADVRSRQRFENGQIVYQEVISEEAQLTSGENPPTVLVQLPATVKPGAQYGFDAIVQEPLGNRLLLGRAVEEGVTSEGFFSPRPIELEQLAAGGLFKVGRAPSQADQRWISAVLVREDGFVIHTRRLQIEE